MEKNIKFTKDKTKGEEVGDEEERTQDGALENTSGNRGGFGTE